jgi:hypothetical protein
LSFSESLAAEQALPALAELRAGLPERMGVWAGGRSTALRGVRIPGIRVMARLVDISEAVGQWRGDFGRPGD